MMNPSLSQRDFFTLLKSEINNRSHLDPSMQLKDKDDTIVCFISILDYITSEYLSNLFGLLDIVLFSNANNVELMEKLKRKRFQCSILIQHLIEIIKLELGIDQSEENIPEDSLLKTRIDIAKFISFLFFTNESPCEKREQVGSFRICCEEHQSQNYELAYVALLNALSKRCFSPTSLSVLLLEFKTQLVLLNLKSFSEMQSRLDKYFLGKPEACPFRRQLQKDSLENELIIHYYEQGLVNRVRLFKEVNPSQFTAQLVQLKSMHSNDKFEKAAYQYAKMVSGFLEKPLLHSLNEVFIIGKGEKKKTLSGVIFGDVVTKLGMSLKEVTNGLNGEIKQFIENSGIKKFEPAEPVKNASCHETIKEQLIHDKVNELTKPNQFSASNVPRSMNIIIGGNIANSDQGHHEQRISRFTRDVLDDQKERVIKTSPANTAKNALDSKIPAPSIENKNIKEVQWISNKENVVKTMTNHSDREKLQGNNATGEKPHAIYDISKLKKTPIKRKLIERTSTAERINWSEDSDLSSVEHAQTYLPSFSEPTRPKPKAQTPIENLNRNSIADVPDSIDKFHRKGKKRFFTDEEVNYLIDGYKKYGHQWKLIADSYPFWDRTPMDLKDKVRNLKKHGIL